MDDEQDDFAAAFGPDTTPQEPVAPEPVVEEQPVVEPVAEPAPPPVVEPEAKPDPQHVPITALLDERDKRKALEQELERFRAAQKPVEAPAVPDMFDDPEGFAAYQEQRVASTALNTKLDISEEMARDKFGDEEVEAAKNWVLAQAQIKPGFGNEVISQRHPYKYAVELYRRDQMASQFNPDDFAQFQAWKAAQSAVQEQTKPPVTAPPRSLASAPSAGSILTEVDPSEEEAFAQTFKR